jgi:hypothetical protein
MNKALLLVAGQVIEKFAISQTVYTCVDETPFFDSIVFIRFIWKTNMRQNLLKK